MANKTRYEVRTVDVDTKDGLNALEVFNNKTNQDTKLVASFDTLEEAKAFYENIGTEARRGGYNLYTHYCKLIEEAEYDEDGEWVGGGDWWEMEFPDIPEYEEE